jgi:predicted RNase H-related nuclease YkuK (DUF458 family)
MVYKRMIDGNKVDLKPYLDSFISNNPKTEVFLSCDSQNKGESTVFAVAIILYNRGVGGHVLYTKKKIPRKVFGKASGKDYEKLLQEAIFLKEVASEINEIIGRKIDLIGLDYNLDERYFSNSLLITGIWMLNGSAKEVKGKPNCAVYAADKIVKS